MKDWTKLNTFDSVYEAEIRKDLLREHDINAIVICKKDSVFLWGQIELFVENKDLEQARALINEFTGWTRINSFSKSQPVRLLEKIIEQQGIETMFLEKSEVSYLLDNYALFVPNHQAPQAREIVLRMEGWKMVARVDNQLQAEIRSNILNDKDINTIVIKVRGSSMHVDALRIYVPKDDFAAAETALQNLEGWTLLHDKLSEKKAMQYLELLTKAGIPALHKVDFVDGNYQSARLYVPTEQLTQAANEISTHIKLSYVGNFSSLIMADFLNSILIDNGLNSSLLIKKDSAFLVGEIEVYVEESEAEVAQKLYHEFVTST